MPPTFVCPICLYTSIHLYTPRGVYTQYPPFSSVHLYVLRGFCMLWGGCKGPPYMLNTYLTPPPVWGCLSFSLHPHSFIGSPVHWYVSGISVCHMGIFPLCWGFGGVPHLLGVLGASVNGMSICSFFYIFVVHYVPRFYYTYNYYSSSYGGIF